jgi:phosphatidylinositol dimannoside acyltransferase
VFLVFCTHLDYGRFALEIEAIGHLRAGEEELAVADYLKQLEARIVASPEDAIAHLEWPCYVSPPAPAPVSTRRRTVAASHR